MYSCTEGLGFLHINFGDTVQIRVVIILLFLKVFMYFILALLGPPCSGGFSLVMVVVVGLLCDAQASDGSGFSCCEARALGHTGFSRHGT